MSEEINATEEFLRVRRLKEFVRELPKRVDKLACRSCSRHGHSSDNDHPHSTCARIVRLSRAIEREVKEILEK